MDSIEKGLVNIEKAIVKYFNEGKLKEILQFFDKEHFIGFSSTKHERVTNLSALKKTFHVCMWFFRN